MKKILLGFMVLLGVVTLAACGNGTEPVVPTDPTQPTEPTDPTDPTQPGERTIDLNAIYRTSIGPTSSMNPHSETLANASTLFGWLTAGLYMGDYDWEAAIADGIATEVGDFTNTAELSYNRFPHMAAERPVDVSPEGESGTIWRITLRDDLVFEDGTPITAETYSYSWKMLLDPLLLNDRASNLYDEANLPLVNGERYFRQGSARCNADGELQSGAEEICPSVDWSEVGFKVINDTTFEITLSLRKNQWQVMGNLLSGITGVVHEASYEAGMNAARTLTTYGTIENHLVSYGPYILTNWEEDVVFTYSRNNSYPFASDYRIGRIRYDVISDQSLIVEEFRAGRLDVAGVAGAFFQEFRDNPTIQFSPVTTFFRFAFNIGPRPGGGVPNPILEVPEFRLAFYHAIDRETFAAEVRPPAVGAQAPMGSVYFSSEDNQAAYRDSEPGRAVLANLFPETLGYNPVLARQLFDEAYNGLVASGKIPAGFVTEVEYTFFDAETNFIVANWVKDTVEEIFNGDGPVRFRLRLTPLSSDALQSGWRSKDYDMTFGGWQGLQFNAPAMLGQVYNSRLTFILEGGFETENIEMVVNLSGLKDILPTWIADLEAIAEERDLSTGEEKYLEDFNEVLGNFAANGNYTVTFDRALFFLVFNIMDYEFYDARPDDLDRITAAMEKVVLDLMIHIPLFNNVGVAVYSDSVVFEAQEHHPWMAWGGFRYMYMLGE